MKILSIILTKVISLTIVSCYPRGDDDSVMGPGEKLVGTWIEDDTDTNVLYYGVTRFSITSYVCNYL